MPTVFCVTIFEFKSSSTIKSFDQSPESYKLDSSSSPGKSQVDNAPNLLNAQETSSHHGLRTTASHHHHNHEATEEEDEVEDTIEESATHHHHDRTFREERDSIQSDIHPEEVDVGIN